jgi:hypothetical protein
MLNLMIAEQRGICEDETHSQYKEREQRRGEKRKEVGMFAHAYY